MVLVAVRSQPVDMKRLCLHSVGERDRFCHVRGEGVHPDVEFYEGFLGCVGPGKHLRAMVRSVYRSFMG